MSAMPPKQKQIQRISLTSNGQRGSGYRRRRVSNSELKPRIMRYELSDYAWTAIKPMLPNKQTWHLTCK